MIKLKLYDGTLILGLSEENIRRLKKGMSIHFDGRPLGMPGHVYILYGETEDAIMQELHQEIDIQGNA